MITVHHLNNSRSQRVLWLLEELEVPYEIIRYQRQPDMRAPPTLRAVHPLGKSPVITDEGRTIAESGAIAEYLVEHYGEGRMAPERGSDERFRYTYWLHYAEGSLMPLLFLKLVFGVIAQRPMPFIIKPVVRGLTSKVDEGLIAPQLELHYQFVEDELGKSAWLAGEELTAADVQMSFPLEAATGRGGVDRQRYPRIHAFVERVHARPAYQRALSRGGEDKVL
jgi:glutathione S-transferase